MLFFYLRKLIKEFFFLDRLDHNTDICNGLADQDLEGALKAIEGDEMVKKNLKRNYRQVHHSNLQISLTCTMLKM